MDLRDLTYLLLGLVVSAILSFTCSFAFAMDPYKHLPTADELNSAIDREGAKAVLWEGLWSEGNGNVFESLMGKIQSGDAKWLRLAARLRPVSDAGASEQLDAAVSDALPRAPGRVLRVTTLSDGADRYSIPSICSGRFLLRKDYPPEKASRWYEDSERALLGFKAADLEAKRTACLAEVRRSHHLSLTRKAER